MVYYMFIIDGTAKPDDKKPTAATVSDSPSIVKEPQPEAKQETTPSIKKSNSFLEKWILEYLSDKNLSIPVDSLQMMVAWSKVSFYTGLCMCISAMKFHKSQYNLK